MRPSSPFAPRRNIAPKLAASALSAGALFLATSRAEAQTPAPIPERSDAWNQATTVMALSAGALVLVMPRTFYSDPEVTVGWKARWHLSVLAPVMTLATLTLVNEHYLKNDFAGARPGCDDTNQGLTGCTTYGMLSTQSFAAFGAFGQGAGIFIADTTKWSGGRFNAGSFVGLVAAPLVLSVITAVGRTAGNWESGGQVWGSAGIGAGVGFATGLLYGMMQRPECGYTGSLLCW